MSIECIRNAKLEDTGFNYTMSLIQGKYKMFILYALMGYGVVRFNELKKYDIRQFVRSGRVCVTNDPVEYVTKFLEERDEEMKTINK